MPKIVEEYQYNGAQERIVRLGLTPLFEELRLILTGFVLRVKEERDANGGAAVRKLIDQRFPESWTKAKVIALEHDGAGPALAKQAKGSRYE